MPSGCRRCVVLFKDSPRCTGGLQAMSGTEKDVNHDVTCTKTVPELEEEEEEEDCVASHPPTHVA